MINNTHYDTENQNIMKTRLQPAYKPWHGGLQSMSCICSPLSYGADKGAGINARAEGLWDKEMGKDGMTSDACWPNGEDTRGAELGEWL